AKRGWGETTAPRLPPPPRPSPARGGGGGSWVAPCSLRTCSRTMNPTKVGRQSFADVLRRSGRTRRQRIADLRRLRGEAGSWRGMRGVRLHRHRHRHRHRQRQRAQWIRYGAEYRLAAAGADQVLKLRTRHTRSSALPLFRSSALQPSECPTVAMSGDASTFPGAGRGSMAGFRLSPLETRTDQPVEACWVTTRNDAFFGCRGVISFSLFSRRLSTIAKN
ncbi:MAG: hypothetical protein JWQ90_5243, partial [Hydrocarboniphaga sp.]|nr:hypothetical protein [Hydrocarboniphaga sp.]